jgi:hypothetical protein
MLVAVSLGICCAANGGGHDEAHLDSPACISFCLKSFIGEQNNVKPQGAWSGVIINSGCTVDEAFAEAAKCTDKLRGPKLALYDDTTREMFDLEPQTEAAGHLGDALTVRGALEGNTIQVSSLERLTSIGLSAGQKAPAFSARDQFGREQTLESLKAPRGTILLFFRSADW